MGKAMAHHKEETIQAHRLERARKYCKEVIRKQDYTNYDRLVDLMEMMKKSTLKDLASFLMLEFCKDPDFTKKLSKAPEKSSKYFHLYGMTLEDMSAKINMAPGTISVHLRDTDRKGRILAKLGIENKK